MGDRENWSNGKFKSQSVFQKQNISIGHYEKIEKWLPFFKYQLLEKISNYWLPKLWVSSFLNVNGNRISALAIMEKNDKWLPFYKYQAYGKISNYWPTQSLGCQFSKCWQKWDISISHYGKIEKWLPFHEYWSFGSPIYPTSHLCVVLHFLIL